MEEAQAGVVGVVHVVDGEQQAVRRRREPDQLGGGDEQPLVRAARRSTGISAPAEGAVDLLAVMVGEAVEQRRVPPAHVGERLDDRRVGPRALDRRRRAVPDAEAQLPGAVRDRREQRRLADAGRRR